MGSDRKQVFIYGSCVSRDTAEFFEPWHLEMVGYVARQSLVSAFGAKRHSWTMLVADNLDSAFQRGAVEGDLRATLSSALNERRDDVDVLLMDLVDERNGVIRFPDGAIVTNSLELVRSNLLDRVGTPGELIEFGSSEHFELWQEALDRFLDFLGGIGLRAKVLLLKHEWATESIEGLRFPFGESTLDPARVNDLTRLYSEAAASRSIAILEVPIDLCLTTIEHQGGIAPYHYTKEFYTFAASEISGGIVGVE